MLNSIQWSFTIICTILCIFCQADNSKKSCSSPNVRTVIFRQKDMEKKCWSREEIALLFTRRMMQELLPKKKVEAVPLLMEYFKECLLTVQKLATSKKTHSLLTLALADTLGGYLQAFGLPMAYQAFYEGTLCYTVPQQLNALQCALKTRLKTDGGGWTKPLKVKKSDSIPPLVLSKIPVNTDQCQTLLKQNELYVSKNNKDVNILLPFLDDTNNPTAMAMPIKDKNLCGLKSYCCANILIKYYAKSIWCLMQTYGTSSIPDRGESQVNQVQSFLNSFHQWLTNNIIPMLDDNNFYPPFGSVLRIIDHLESKVKSKTISKKKKNRHKLKNTEIDEVFLDETDNLTYTPLLYTEIMAYKPHLTKRRKGSKRQVDGAKNQTREKCNQDNTTTKDSKNENSTEAEETGRTAFKYSQKVIYIFASLIFLLAGIILFLLCKLCTITIPQAKCEEEYQSTISSIDSSIRNKCCAQFTNKSTFRSK